MSSCACGSGKSLEACCGPIIKGAKKAENPEVLMRARYTAFAQGAVDFIEVSLHPDMRKDFNKKEAEAWSKQSEWHGLKIIESTGNDIKDEEGKVEFVAQYSHGGAKVDHHELAEFRKQGGDWYFYDAKLFQTPLRRANPKVGRNDPCSCGSGKKFKKCCGANSAA